MTDMRNSETEVVIIGAGPAGLTAAYELCKEEIGSIVLEKDKVVGGISRTVNYKGYLFDIGGHRFFTKVGLVDQFWRDVLPEEDFLKCPRLSRIYYNGKFYSYPIQASNALQNLGVWNSTLVLLSYLKARFFPLPEEKTFEDWVYNRFGQRLYEMFFKTYTEKVWGMPCKEISADWAAQRIKGLSLSAAVKNALLPPRESGNKEKVIKTLIDTFHYPRRGPGMMWEQVVEKVKARGGQVRLQSSVEKVIYSGRRAQGVAIETPDGPEFIRSEQVISSMPVRELINKMEPAAPREVVEAAMGLNYRDFLTVALIIRQRDLFPDNWIYIHDPGVKVGRIQNFKNWSADMVPDPETTCLGLEYFCFEGDGLWTMSDEDLISLATQEIDKLGLAHTSDVIDGCVVRMPKAYPVYDANYRNYLRIIRDFLDRIENLHLVGRNGMHRYNNQDHSMLTAMLAVRNILGARYDLWEVNDDDNYHEEVGSSEQDRYTSDWALLNTSQPSVPTRKAANF